MEQLINRISQETRLNREQIASMIDLLLRIGCTRSEIQEIYEVQGIEGVLALANSCSYKLAERSKVLHELITVTIEETKIKRFLKWICVGRK